MDAQLDAGPPAARLLGLELPSGWRVVEAVSRPKVATGGNFSYSYIVESDERGRAFLKAIDYSWAMQQTRPSEAIKPLVDAFTYERNLCKLCKDRRLSRVVHPIDEGTVAVDPATLVGTVEYIIFELGEGDVRCVLDSMDRFDLAWTLRTLHHVATGLRQLHNIPVAHQDVKPSNVLVFEQKASKLADLGCASKRDDPAPSEGLDIAGDPAYAPPDRLYRSQDSDWPTRRLSCDLYLLGNLVVFLFSRGSMNALITRHLHNEHQPINWGGSYAELLPHLRHAFGMALEDFATDVPNCVREGIVRITMELCDPDPALRGHPATRHSSGRFSLERYVSEFNLLASKAEHRLLSEP